jgi:hypothetical protein
MMDSLPAAFLPWQIGRPDVAFDLGESDLLSDSALWNCDLPANLQDAMNILDRQETDQHRVIHQLDSVPGRIEALAAQTHNKAAADVAFASGDSLALGREEGFFLEELNALNPASLPIHFGIGDSPAKSWQTAFDQFQRTTDHVQLLISQLARVETRLGGKLVGRTIINIKGDLQTDWEDPINPEQSALHLRSLRQALASRTALIKMLSFTVQGAFLAATWIGGPGSVLLALPATWRYIQAIMNQVSDAQRNATTLQEV